MIVHAAGRAMAKAAGVCNVVWRAEADLSLKWWNTRSKLPMVQVQRTILTAPFYSAYLAILRLSTSRLLCEGKPLCDNSLIRQIAVSSFVFGLDHFGEQGVNDEMNGELSNLEEKSSSGPQTDQKRWAMVKTKLRSIISNAQKLSRGHNRFGHTLGIDLGDSRTGVAVSLTGFAPRPLDVLQLKGEKLIEGLLQIAAKEKADEFVLGLPISHDGKETLQSNKARSFAGRLATQAAQRGWRVYLVNEYGSSQDGLDQMLEMAIKKRSRRQMSDAYAAMALLRSYFSADGVQAHLVVPKGVLNQETLCLGDRSAHVSSDED